MARREAEARSWTAEYARCVLEEWERSGQSVTAYARSVGVVPQRLFWWRRRLSESARGLPAAKTPTSLLIPVEVRGATGVAARAGAAAPVVVTTRGGARIEVNEVNAASATWVAVLLKGEGAS